MKIQSLIDEAAARLLSGSNALDEVAIDRGLVHGGGVWVATPRIAANLLLIAAVPLVLADSLAREVERRRAPRVIRRRSVMVVGRPQLGAYC